LGLGVAADRVERLSKERSLESHDIRSAHHSAPQSLLLWLDNAPDIDNKYWWHGVMCHALAIGDWFDVA
jgi:hypothetical protein